MVQAQSCLRKLISRIVCLGQQQAYGHRTSKSQKLSEGRDRMNMKQRIELFEDDSAILESIAAQYPEDSKQRIALRHAAIALWYVLAEGHEKFRDYVAKFQGDLNAEQRAHLFELGIDPDAEFS
jgi:hypothetical protein